MISLLPKGEDEEMGGEMGGEKNYNFKKSLSNVFSPSLTLSFKE